ncbi:hypothetical protein CRV08_14965 [Halarcobacter ebronensis]|uniref:Lipoprotein n=1 Tax=Halarcobacter ebronensis TaxID=1462615 RepID=A0A4V1LQR1_9BACT|nr:hypothetical protein [Halarcobacter ebronensis]RXJ65578.1 hypothetical protein CRV08_14965 [Halarcobacter ebronensis]
MIKFFKYSFILSAFLIFSGCASTQEELTSIIQSNAATLITKDQKRLQELLVKFKKKLDIRNPSAYSKNDERRIYTLIKNTNANFLLKYKGKILEDYKEYLQIAFSKDKIENRNDYLVLAIYYMISNAFDFKVAHKLTAMQFEKEKLNKLYKNLQIIRWKIKVDRDINGEYLFLTWQNNWQIELEHRLKKNSNLSYEEIKHLWHIENSKETLLDHSNFSFEVMLTQMIDSVENSLKALGEEPKDLSISALKIFIFL